MPELILRRFAVFSWMLRLTPRFVFLTLWLALFAIVLTAYVFLNPPLARVAHNLAPLGVAFLFLIATCGIGAPLLWLLKTVEDPWTRLVTSLGLGIGLTGVINFSTGMLGFFRTSFFLIWTGLGTVLFIVLILQELRKFFTGSVAISFWTVMGFSIMAIFITAEIPFIVAPEVSTDSLAYHLLVPQFYLSAGKVFHIPLLVEAYYPSLAEYNYIAILDLTDEIVCKCFHFWLGLSVLLALARIVKRVSPDATSLLAPALFVSMPVTAIHIGWAWNDFLFVLLILLSVYYLLEYHLAVGARNSRHLLLSGVFMGLASWTKYTFVIYFLSFLILLAYGAKKWKWETKHYPLFFLGVALVSPFWIVQNWIFTGNPVYPFLHQIFHSPFWTDNSNAYFHNALRRWELPVWNVRTYLSFPLTITLRPRLVDIHTGILSLVLLPFAFIRSDSKGISFLKGFLLSGLFIWILIHTETRSIFTLFAILFCVTSVTLQKLSWPALFVRRAAGVLIFVSIMMNFFLSLLTTYALFDPVRYFLGLETRQQYISRLGPAQPAYDYLNSLREPGRAVLVSLHEPYYLRRSYFFSSFADPPIAEVLTSEISDLDRLGEKLRRLGIRYFVIDMENYRRENAEHLYSWPVTQQKLFEAFVNTRCKPLWKLGNLVIARVR